MWSLLILFVVQWELVTSTGLFWKANCVWKYPSANFNDRNRPVGNTEKNSQWTLCSTWNHEVTGYPMSMVTMSQSYWAADKMLGLAMPHAYEAFPRIGWIPFLRFFGQLFLRTLWRGTENQTTRAVSTSQQQLVDLQILWSGPSMWNGLQLPGQRCFHVVSSEAALNVKPWVLKLCNIDIHWGYPGTTQVSFLPTNPD